MQRWHKALFWVPVLLLTLENTCYGGLRPFGATQGWGIRAWRSPQDPGAARGQCINTMVPTVWPAVQQVVRPSHDTLECRVLAGNKP